MSYCANAASVRLAARGQPVHDLRSRSWRHLHFFQFEGRGSTANCRVEAAQDLREHGGSPQAIQTGCMDMSAAYMAGVDKAMPPAAIAFDRFHVIQMANAVLEQVRREERHSQPELKRTRWGWLKDFKKWTHKQIQDMHWLTRMRLKTARAWRLKEALRDIYLHCPATTSAAPSRYSVSRLLEIARPSICNDGWATPPWPTPSWTAACKTPPALRPGG